MQIVAAFEFEQSIVLSIGPSLKQLQKKLGGQILTINAPDGAPPPLPRIVLKLEDTILKIGLDRFDITTRPPSHVSQDMVKSCKFAGQRASSIISELTPCILYKWAGVITTFEYPEEPLISKSAIEAAKPIFDKLINIARGDRDLSLFQLQFGLKDNDHFKTYTISAFEGREIKLDSPVDKRFVEIDLKEHPIFECGIQIILDVNNKPCVVNKDPLEDINKILSKQIDLYGNFSSDLNLEGILG